MLTKKQTYTIEGITLVQEMFEALLSSGENVVPLTVVLADIDFLKTRYIVTCEVLNERRQ